LALVTFSRPSDALHLLTHFPYHDWETNRSAGGDDNDPSVEEREARKPGFRTLLKERWEAFPPGCVFALGNTNKAALMRPVLGFAR